MVNQKPGCICVCARACVFWGDLGKWKSLVTKSLLKVLFLKISFHVIEHHLKVSKLVFLPQEVALGDHKERTGLGHRV